MIVFSTCFHDQAFLGHWFQVTVSDLDQEASSLEGAESSSQHLIQISPNKWSINNQRNLIVLNFSKALLWVSLLQMQKRSKTSTRTSQLIESAWPYCLTWAATKSVIKMNIWNSSLSSIKIKHLGSKQNSGSNFLLVTTSRQESNKNLTAMRLSHPLMESFSWLETSRRVKWTEWCNQKTYWNSFTTCLITPRAPKLTYLTLSSITWTFIGFSKWSFRNSSGATRLTRCRLRSFFTNILWTNL